jgi:enoyl-CoA hydratase/carnithine racemase
VSADAHFLAVAEPLRVERDGAVAHVVLNRPEKLNAIDGSMLEALDAAFAQIEDDDGVRAIVLRANGRAFCAGADLAYVTAQMGSTAAYAAFLQHWHDVFGRIERSSRPTVAAVHGVALAGGLELTQVCDVVIAAEGAELGDQHAKFGLFPGGGSTQRLPRLIGRRAATWMLLTGERVTAQVALELGLVTRVVPDVELLDAARGAADQLARCSASANEAIKRAIQQGGHLGLDDALALERAIAVPHMLGADAQLGLEAFRSRSEPDFSGLALRTDATP